MTPGMASQEPMTHATSASGVTTDSQPIDAGSNPKKRKIEEDNTDHSVTN